MELTQLTDSNDRPIGSGDHRVTQGECLSSLSERHGHFWETLWHLPANAALRAARGDPSVLLPGDRLTIPPRESKEVACATGRRHVFRRRGVPAYLKLQFFHGGAPLASARYTLQVDGRDLQPGCLDPEGRLYAAVPCGAALAQIVIDTGKRSRTYTVRLGHLDPLTTPSGIQARLRNLGFACGADGDSGQLAEAAVRAFRAAHGLTEAGGADAAMRAKLLALHGG